MKSNPKSTREGSKGPEARPSGQENPAADFATRFQEGVERMAGIQKSALDVMGANAMDAVQGVGRACNLSSSMRGLVLMSVAGQTIGNAVQMQKKAVDLVVREAEIGAETGRDCAATGSSLFDGVTGLVQRIAGQSIAAQDAVLDFAAEQNRVVGDALKVPCGLCGAPVLMALESVQRGVDTLIKTHKELLEVAAEPIGQGTAEHGGKTA